MEDARRVAEDGADEVGVLRVCLQVRRRARGRGCALRGARRDGEAGEEVIQDNGGRGRKRAGKTVLRRVDAVGRQGDGELRVARFAQT